MHRYKYLAEIKKGGQEEFWACVTCRKNNLNLILLRKWRLIDQSNDERITCTKCGDNIANARIAI